MSTHHVISPTPTSQNQLRYDARQVALMVRVAKFYGSDEQKRELRLLGALEYLRLEKQGDQFIWNVR
jgi:hypothetical protein